MTRILTVIGTRPQYVKSAVLRQSFQEEGVEEFLVDTGQHYDSEMTTQIFMQLGVSAPDKNLNIGGMARGQALGLMISSLEPVIKKVKPDFVLVFGDTTSTLAGALAAKACQINLIHVEAGLRSFDRSMPEEQSRKLVDHLSDMLFCPTLNAITNLSAENIKDGAFFSGDVMLDACIRFAPLYRPPSVQDYASLYSNFDLISIHRSDALSSAGALRERLDYIRNASVADVRLFLVHPHTRKKLDEYGLTLDGFKCLQPQGYLETQWLLSRANHVFTDSGGMQKEAFFHETKTTTLRDTTEWPETLSRGINKLWTNVASDSPRSDKDAFGDGNACRHIIEYIKARV